MKHYYWDSCAFLAFLKAEEGRIDNVKQLLKQAERGECIIITSSMTPAEVVHIKGRPRLTDKEEQAIKDLFDYDFIRFRDVTRKIGESARQLMWRFSTLKPKDSIHLASAIEFAEKNTLDALHTYDPDFINLASDFKKQFPIEHPIPDQPDLPIQPSSTEKINNLLGEHKRALEL